jgi:hypothetical protein
MSVKVFTAEEALAAINADPSKVQVIEKKKETKAYKGTTFLNAFYNIDGTKKQGWFSIEDVPLTIGVADPEDLNDKRNEFEGTRLQLQTSVSKAGPFGEFLVKLDPVFKQNVETLAANGTINLDKKEIHGLVQTHYSANHPEKPNEPMDDGIVRFKLDFDTFPATYPHKFLRGQPKTQFFDYSTRYVDENGREQFKIAMVENDAGDMEPVTSKNLHKFATKGSIIRRGRIMMPSVPVSKGYVSHPIVCNRVILETGAEDGFSDDAPPATNANVKAAFVPKPTQTTPTATATTSVETEAPTANVNQAEIDDITNLLNSME